MNNPISIPESINNKLTEAFKPSKLEIIDESAPHKGHSGYSDAGSSHLRVVISKEPFEGMNRVARQRAVFKTIAEEMKIVHALNIDFV